MDIFDGRDNYIDEQTMTHYGMPKRSGRYPWGSGENPYQGMSDFINRVKEYKKAGMTEREIADVMKVGSVRELRAYHSIAINDIRYNRMARLNSILADGKTLSEAERIMGINESTLRGYLKESTQARANAAVATSEFLRDRLKDHKMIDIGNGVENELGISKEKLNEAATILKAEGYVELQRRIPQATNDGAYTTVKLLCRPGTEYKDAYNNDDIGSIKDFVVRQDANGNDVFDKAFVYPKSIDSDRVKIRYAEEGGSLKDGVVELRRGVDDLSLGESHYSQVRVLVDDKKYIKGMAVYGDDKDMPQGVDIIFNTNKSLGTSKADVLKNISEDPDNPFGALIKEHGGQSYYFDKDGNRNLSAINKARDESDWSDWSNSVPAQFLSKQKLELVDRQLNKSMEESKKELSDILELTNPVVKKEFLRAYADECDSTSETLHAASFSNQKYHVILPVNSLKDNEVYAPNYKNGETLALIRYPHGGTFEIPIVKVNNNNQEAKKMMGETASDGIGITAKVANRLSGADFDGDTVMAIPCNSASSTIKITSTPQLEGLKTFDPKLEYSYRPGAKLMKYDKVETRNGEKIKRTVDLTQSEMGKISNLVNDMTIKGATEKDIERAVKHSMVVIDAAKHKLDYSRSYTENGIDALKKKYQPRVRGDGAEVGGGASTLISKAKSRTFVDLYRGNPNIDPATGELSYTQAFTKNQRPKQLSVKYDHTTGEWKTKRRETTLMAETKDAYSLSSGTPVESLYANYANFMKAQANEARKQLIATPNLVYSSSAKKAYAKEVADLNAKLQISLKNAPRERMAQIYADSVVKAKKKANPDMTSKERKKHAQMALVEGRNVFNAKRSEINITPNEWKAIQAGAITNNTLTKMLQKSNKEQLRAYSMPRQAKLITASKLARINRLKANGLTTAEIAEAIGVSASTIQNALNGKE